MTDKKRFHYECPDGSFIGYTSDKECDPERMKNLYEYVLKPVEEATIREMEVEAKQMKQIELEIKRFISCVPEKYTSQDIGLIVKEVWKAKNNDTLPESIKHLTNKEWVYYITSICDSDDNRDMEVVRKIFKTITNTWGNDCWR